MVRNIIIAVLAIALLSVIFVAYLVVDASLIQPSKHARNTQYGERINEAYLSDGFVDIHQIAYLVKIEDKRIMVWSELACARKWKTAPKTLKSPGYSRLAHFGLNDAEVRFRISDDLDFVAKPRSGSVCDLVANLERDLPTVLRPYTYSVAIEPATRSCDSYVNLLQKDAFSSDFGPLQVRSTRTVPVHEVFSREAYVPDAVDASLSETRDSPVPDIRTHIDSLKQSWCS